MLVLPAACGGGDADDEATGGTGTRAPAEEPSDDRSGELPDADAAISDAEDIADSEPATGEPDGDQAGDGEVAPVGAESATAPDDKPDAELDPCTLVTAEEWRAWLDDTEPDGGPVHLEYGEACGHLAEGDEVRLAIALIELGDRRWLDGVDSETVDVGGHDARWAEAHPIAASSTLTVATPAGEIIVEMSGGDREQQRDGAVHFAELALARVQS
jgi:hypothetical protein